MHYAKYQLHLLELKPVRRDAAQLALPQPKRDDEAGSWKVQITAGDWNHVHWRRQEASGQVQGTHVGPPAPSPSSHLLVAL